MSKPHAYLTKKKLEIDGLGYTAEEEIRFEKRSLNNRKTLSIRVKDRNGNYSHIEMPWSFAEDLSSFIVDGPAITHGKSKVSQNSEELIGQMRELRLAFSAIKSGVNKMEGIVEQHKLAADVARNNTLPESNKRRFDFDD